MPLLENIQGYTGRLLPTGILDANGVITYFPTILVQVQLVRDDNTPWGDWIDELAILRQPGPNLLRLSGVGIRDVLYFGTAPSNHVLAVTDSGPLAWGGGDLSGPSLKVDDFW